MVVEDDPRDVPVGTPRNESMDDWITRVECSMPGLQALNADVTSSNAGYAATRVDTALSTASMCSHVWDSN